MKFKLIVAVDEKLGIGKKNKISWTNKTDLRFFRKKTSEVPENSTKQNMIISTKTICSKKIITSSIPTHSFFCWIKFNRSTSVILSYIF